MVWERVDGGLLGTGEPFVIERQVFHVEIPYSVEPLIVRRRRYRVRVQADDGTFADAGRAQTRPEIDALAASFGATSTGKATTDLAGGDGSPEG